MEFGMFIVTVYLQIGHVQNIEESVYIKDEPL